MEINKKSLAIFISLLFVLLLILFLNLKSIGRRPELHNLSNSVAGPGDTITLYGDYFGGEISRGRVYINDKMIFKEFIISWSNSEIVLKLSDDFKSGMITVNNMFGESSPYLITSKNDVPEIRDDLMATNVPFIEDAQFIDITDLKISVNGRSFGINDTNSKLIVQGINGDIVNINRKSIIEWNDDRLTFFLPVGMNNIIISISNSSGESNEFTLHKSEIPPIVYIAREQITYSLKQVIEIDNVITLGDGIVNLYVPCVYEDQNQKNIVFGDLRGKYNSLLNIYDYNLKFSETGDTDTVTLETLVDVGNLETKIRSELIGRKYDIESPDVISGFLKTPNIDHENKDIKNTGVWLVRNTKNRITQVEILTDWLLRYIEINSESSENAVTGFKNRVTNEFGLINITISMLRSVGIPTRIISGIKVQDEITNYRWLEFYLPNGGWVPFDLLRMSLDDSYVIGNLKNNLIGFTKGVTNINYQYDNFKSGFYALQNNTSNFEGNIESYDAIWHNVVIK